MKKLFLKLIFISCISFFAVIILGYNNFTNAASFDAGRIIDDSIFTNKNSMSANDIQNFLNSKVPVCDTNHQGGNPNYPPPYICLKNYTEGGRSAAQIIYDAAQQYSINPQVILVTLQKENGLVTDSWPYPWQYRTAMGFGCPDGEPCDAQWYGFTNQINQGVRHLRNFYDLNPNWYIPFSPGVRFVPYNPNGGCGGSNVNIINRATAALYSYTPYQPNTAALSTKYGTGDGCSAYGNRNFFNYFNDWFGNSRIDSFSVALDESTNSQYLLFGGLKQAITDPQIKIAWGIQDYPLTTMSSSYLSTIPNGPNLDRLTRLNTSDLTVFFMDGGKRYRVMSSPMFESWNFGNRPITNVPPELFYIPTDGGELTYTVKNPANSTLYTLDGGNNSQQTILRPFSSTSVQKAWEGDNSAYTSVSSNFFDQIDDAIGTSITSTKITNGGQEYQVVNGSRYSQPSPYSLIYPSTAQEMSAKTINRLLDKGTTSHLIRSSSANTVYLIDNNTKRVVSEPNVLAAWTQPGGGVQLVNNNYLSLIPDGQLLDKYFSDSGGQIYIMNGSKSNIPNQLLNAYQGAQTTAITTYLMSIFPQSNTTVTGFIRASNSPHVYFLDESGQKRHIESPSKADLYGAYTEGITILPDSVVAAIPSAPSPNLYVGDGVSEYVIEGGVKHQVDSITKANWGLNNLQLYSDNTLSRFSTGSSLQSKAKSGNNYYLIREGKAFLTVDNNIADIWSIGNAPTINPSLVTSILSLNMLTRFVNSTTDNRTFVIDGGNWYSVSSNHLANLGGSNAPKMGLNPSNAPNVVSDWTSIVVKDAANKHYVIDGGLKKAFNHQVIQNHWTNNGQLSVPTTTNGFLNLLPNKGKVERAIKGSAPAVYSAENATKRHILYSTTYNLYYAPFELVSDELINALPSGSDIY